MLKIHVFFKHLLCVATVGTALATANTAAAESLMQDGYYSYDIMRNGTQIGSYTFDVSTTDDVTTINARMGIEVKVLFLTAYKADHQRTEKYLKGKLLSMKGDAVFNSKNYEFSFDASTNTLVHNGDEQVLDQSAVTLTPFIPKSLESAVTGISEKGKPYQAHFEDNGTVKKKSGIKLKPFREIVLMGEARRDLWYTPEGVLDSLSYDKDGATITFKRQY